MPAQQEGNQRRRLEQASDYQPALAMRAGAPPPVATTPATAVGAALAQQLHNAGGALPRPKAGGRRKRAVQARDDLDAVGLVFGHRDFAHAVVGRCALAEIGGHGEAQRGAARRSEA